MLSKKTFLKICNETDLNMSIRISDIDNFDWDGVSRPDNNFQNATIPAGQSIKEREEINARSSSCPFRMHITFENNETVNFRNDQRDALTQISLRNYPLEGSNKNDYLLTQEADGECNTFRFQRLKSESTTWMESMEDAMPISYLQIPGTHDSCAKIGGEMVECQSHTLEEQLKMGIRFVDIRCRHINDGFAIHHGSYYQEMNFGDVVDICTNFLSKNPSEFIIMSVKEEYTPSNNTRSFEKTLKEKYWSSYFYTENTIPIIEDVRGKIVLISRYKDPSIGIKAYSGWKDNDTFSIGNTLRVQDEYKTSVATKWKKISDLLAESKNSYAICLYLNFCSAVGGLIPSPKSMANEINPKVYEYCLNNKSARTGILIMDFPDESVIKAIIDLNCQFQSLLATNKNK